MPIVRCVDAVAGFIGIQGIICFNPILRFGAQKGMVAGCQTFGKNCTLRAVSDGVPSGQEKGQTGSFIDGQPTHGTSALIVGRWSTVMEADQLTAVPDAAAHLRRKHAVA